ncbi:phage terminase large subunit family protein [Paraclostridium sordellii]|nr:phage terminase large subunit family protein [Paeniclostridium sordellii]
MAHILQLVTKRTCHHCSEKFMVIEVRGIAYYQCAKCGCMTKK